MYFCEHECQQKQLTMDVVGNKDIDGDFRLSPVTIQKYDRCLDTAFDAHLIQ